MCLKFMCFYIPLIAYDFHTTEAAVKTPDTIA